MVNAAYSGTDRPDIPDHFPDDFDLDTGYGQIVSDEEYIEWYQKKLEREYEPPEKPKSLVDVEAEVGPLKFKPEFSDPTIDITTNRDSARHSVVSGQSENGSSEDFFVQAQGKKPTQIEIDGWVTEDQLDVVDNLVSQVKVKIISNRWTGTAVPEEVRTAYDRAFHETHGFIFNTTISLIAATRGEIPTESENSDEDN